MTGFRRTFDTGYRSEASGGGDGGIGGRCARGKEGLIRADKEAAGARRCCLASL